MVLYIYCKNCGKVVDEYEKCCHWCGFENSINKKEEKEANNERAN